MDISIVIPAFNEEKRIKKTLELIIAYLKKQGYNYEILVINDGSTDKTKDVVLSLKKSLKNKRINIIDNQCNKGKGYSVKQGFLNATKSWILVTDADLSTPIEELETCLRYADTAQIIIGSRNMPMSQIVVKQPFIRSTFGKIFPILVRIFLLPEIKDTQCGFKLFRKDAAKAVAQKEIIDRFCFDAEQLFIAKKIGYSIKEVPISWYNDERSKIRIIKDSLQMFVDIFRIRLYDFKGLYE